MTDIPVTVLIAPPTGLSFDKVRQAAEAAGFKTQRSLPGIGVVVGTVSPDRVRELQAVNGIAAVEREGSFALPPLRETMPQ